ncbi:MAG: hypothetical protein M3O71_01065 [Bacteroidota bacterium]|nr:hypothetical protein [Bacteroidota bacterium]
MRRRFWIILLLTSICSYNYAQTPIDRSIELHTQISDDTRVKLLDALDALLIRINNSKPVLSEINPVGNALTLSILNDLKGIENNEKAGDKHYYKPRLINLYPIDNERYIISLAYVNQTAPGVPIRVIFNFIASLNDSQVTFSIPVYYITQDWKTTKVGNITYHYADKINIGRARVFDKKNTNIAVKLGLKPEPLDFYLCNNYQEIMHLLGYEYNSESAGVTTDGYGVDARTIFSTMHNEDFSHDTFHYYSGKFRKNVRNSAADEGVAYSWGNAYYTDNNGEIISPKQLVPQLKQYLQQHPGASLLNLFYKNPLILTNQTKVRSLLASMVCYEVERQKGVEGVKELLNCGKGDDSFFLVVNKLIGVNPINFDERVGKLIENYK